MFSSLFNKRERHKPPPWPKWLKWTLIAFALYLALMSQGPKQSKTRQAIDQAKTEISQVTTERFSGYKNQIFPEYGGAGLRIQDVSAGEGKAAVCGQHVRIAYQSYLAQGNMLNDRATADKPLAFTIGEGYAMPVFDRGVIGMKKGGKRSVVAPPLMSYGLEDYRRSDVPHDAHVRMEMELLDVTPVLPNEEVQPYRIADLTLGNGGVVVCGEPVYLQLKVWDASGKMLWSNVGKDPMLITPGRSEIMLGVEQAIIGMLERGTRLIIIPPSFQVTMQGNASKHPIPTSATTLLIVEAYVTARYLGDKRKETP